MDLEKRLNQLKNRVGLVGGALLINRLSDAEHNISACIDPKDWHIELSIRDGWNPAPDEKTRSYLRQKNVSDAIWTVLRDVVYHECGHWALPRGSKNGCPRSSELHDVILDGVVKARDKKGRQRNEGLEHYIANSFEDILSNTFCKTQTTHTGQILFYNDQGLSAPEQKYGKFYEAFVKLNLYLWGDSHDEKLLKRFYKNEPKTIDAVKKVIETLEFKKKSFLESGIKYRSTDEVVKAFRDETGWSRMAHDYTMIMDNLLDEQMPQEMLFGVGNPSSGKKSKPKKGKKQGNKGNSGGQEKSDGGSAFDKKLEGDKEGVIVGRFKSGAGKASYMDNFEYLDSVYRSLGREIPVKVELFRQEHSFPVAHYGSQEFDPEIHDFARMKLSRIGIGADAEVAFQTHRGDITIPAMYVKNLRGFPNLKVVNLDTSGSMQEPLFGSDVGRIVNPFAPEGQQWGDGSKYHHALIGKYGIDAYLEMQGIAGEVDSVLINFSSSSIASKKQKLGSRTEENKLALSPQFGGTQLDCNTLEKALGKDSSFVLSLSDGEFQNWDSVKNRFRSVVSNHAYAHIHLGSPNQFTQDLQEWEIPVYFVNSENPLEKLMVDVTQKQYQTYAMEELKNA